MTFTQFTIYVIEYDRQHHKERSGQAAFNALWNVRPDLADALRGGPLDPFYDNSRLPAFWEHLSAVWG